MNSDQTMTGPEDGTGQGAQVQALVGRAEFQPGNTAWVFIDPRSLAQEEIPVFECDIDDVAILTRYDLRGNSKTEIEYTVSLTCSLDSPFRRKEGEVFRTRKDAILFGSALTTKRATEAEEKALRLREIADMMNAA